MFEDKHNKESDILMRSILSEAQEEVPAHIWEGVSAELDRIGGAKVRKPAFIRFGRPIAAAAAAVVAAALLMDWNRPDNIVPEGSGADMIAVVQKEDQTPAEDVAPAEEKSVPAPAYYIADATPHVRAVQKEDNVPAEAVAVEQKVPETPAVGGEVKETVTVQPEKTDAEADYFPQSWPEDEPVRKRRQKTSVTLSGLAGTNSAQNNGTTGPLRRPSISSAPLKTGIRQTSTESTYGLPVSIGAGVKIGLSPRWALGIGANYTYLTRKFYGTYTHVDREGLADKTISSDIRNSQHYIGIPINAYYDIIDREHVNFYAYAGGTVEKCIRNKYDVLSTPVLHTEKVKGVQLSANVGIGVEFILGKHLGLYVDPSLRYYFDNGQPKSIRTEQPLMLGFELGLRLNL